MDEHVEFIVTYSTDDDETGYREFSTWEAAYKWCTKSIETDMESCRIHWVSKTESFGIVKHRKMVQL